MSGQLSYEDCVQLQVLSRIYKTQQKIADAIGCSQSCISRELKRCKQLHIPYNAKIAYDLRQQIRIQVNSLIHSKVQEKSPLALYIKIGLEQYRSPEQITGRRNKGVGADLHETITTPTIYDYIYTHHPERILMYLKRKGKPYKSRCKKQIISNRISIHDRPTEANDRARFGDFEGDTIVGSDKSDRIVTLVDRKSRYLLVDLINDTKKHNGINRTTKLSIATSLSMLTMFSAVPSEKRLTTTLDNGVEFADHEYISYMLSLDIFFADPYSSYQRGTNENTNGLLRYFMPKGTDFKKLTREQVQGYAQIINNRPRKCLGWKTSNEVFHETTSILPPEENYAFGLLI